MFQLPRVSSLQCVPGKVCSVFSNSSSTDFSLCSAPSHPETSRNQISRVEGRVPQSLNPNSQNLKRLSSMLASTPRNHQPVYHKTDAVRSASLWFAAGDWRFGPSIEDGTVWAYATSDVLSGCDRPEFAVNCGDCEITSLRAPSWKNRLRISAYHDLTASIILRRSHPNHLRISL